MSNTIYDISNWAASTVYVLNDIVKYTDAGGNTFFYYCIIPHTSAATFASANWNGTINENGATRPYFFWKPNIGSRADVTPRVKETKFGDGYSQRVPDGINNVLLEFDLTFEGIEEAESAAINHFLHEKEGRKFFIFTPPKPYNKNKRFICPNFTTDFVFHNNYLIRARFKEVPA